jgi:hypothetical protein
MASESEKSAIGGGQVHKAPVLVYTIDPRFNEGFALLFLVFWASLRLRSALVFSR